MQRLPKKLTKRLMNVLAIGDTCQRKVNGRKDTAIFGYAPPFVTWMDTLHLEEIKQKMKY